MIVSKPPDVRAIRLHGIVLSFRVAGLPVAEAIAAAAAQTGEKPEAVGRAFWTINVKRGFV